MKLVILNLVVNAFFILSKKILQNNNIDPHKVNIIFSDGTNIIKISYPDLCKQPYYVSSGSRR